MKELPHTRSCFVCGESNAIGLNLRFHTDGKRVHSCFTPATAHAGFKGVVHGGILSTVLDEIMVWACAVPTRKFAYCVELSVRFNKAARPGEELSVSAEMISSRRDRIFEARSEIQNAKGEIVCSATGRYFAAKPEDAAEMMDDIVGDTNW
ncbi:MAG TPA: PaaI family thioesterase [Verrucomicrobiae bacterium]|nr:PaaI family thioesterase [Verrucomicrobiae bacterium]